MPSNKLHDPEIMISDYGTAFIVEKTPSSTLYTSALYSPPEVLFNEPITRPTAADIWTLGISLYEILGERPLFETISSDPGDVIGDIINTLGRPPERWWDSWVRRSELFKEAGSWVDNFSRISTPEFRPLRQRLWEMGRGETDQTCEWDVAGGELDALEGFLRAMLAFEPAERPTVNQLL
ncbi:kinase domain-containing protein [Penicillium malachiteum]|uniref:Kinase domain-containing protein n=1 Tax=Penicillium malachiteum TaxID=1324776 RepID=A0AAD6HCB7_9EURO|nr:kinase domain-containing protein [Penicillium malachiteum]